MRVCVGLEASREGKPGQFALLVAKKKIKHRISNSTNNHFEDNIHFRREIIKRVWYRGYHFKPRKRKTKTSLSEIENKKTDG